MSSSTNTNRELFCLRRLAYLFFGGFREGMKQSGDRVIVIAEGLATG
jgi:hypothetical protein